MSTDDETLLDSTADEEVTAFYGYQADDDLLIEELLAVLSHPDRQQLHAILKRQQLSGWWAWLALHAQSVERLLMASPAQRKRQSFADEEARLLTAFGAIVFAQYGGGMKPWFGDPDIQGNDNDRNCRAARGRLVWESQRVPIDYWPFAGESPFDD